MDSTSTFWLPPAGSTTASDVDPLFNFILYASSAMFLVVTIGVVYFAWRYRRRKKAGLLTAPTHSTPLELIWTIIPTILVVIIFVWGMKTYIQEHVVPRDALEIKGTGQKWFWSFDYPNGASSVNDLVVPVGRPIRMLLSSKDVIHGFYVPSFRVKMDVLPNRYTVAWFQATRPGDYQLFCTQYCGKGHSEMLGTIKVVSDLQYTHWLDSSSNLGQGLTPEEYGKQLYKTKACITCHNLEGPRLVGPTFKGKFGSMELLADGQQVLVDENYIRESILIPKAKVVKGFDPVMPTYQGLLKDKQIDALIAFIKSLK
jgi:cytochrome c oxidase subunit 2